MDGLEGVALVGGRAARVGVELEATDARLDAEPLGVVRGRQAVEEGAIGRRQRVVRVVVGLPQRVATWIRARGGAGTSARAESGNCAAAEADAPVTGSVCICRIEKSDGRGSNATSVCQPLDVKPRSANEIWRPSVVGFESILPSGRPFSESSWVGWLERSERAGERGQPGAPLEVPARGGWATHMWSDESSGLPARSPSNSARRPMSSGTMSSCAWKKTTPCCETGIATDRKRHLGQPLACRASERRKGGREGRTEDGEVVEERVPLLLGQGEDRLEVGALVEAQAERRRELLTRVVGLVEGARQRERLVLELVGPGEGGRDGLQGGGDGGHGGRGGLSGEAGSGSGEGGRSRVSKQEERLFDQDLSFSPSRRCTTCLRRQYQDGEVGRAAGRSCCRGVLSTFGRFSSSARSASADTRAVSEPLVSPAALQGRANLDDDTSPARHRCPLPPPRPSCSARRRPDPSTAPLPSSLFSTASTLSRRPPAQLPFPLPLPSTHLPLCSPTRRARLSSTASARRP